MASARKQVSTHVTGKLTNEGMTNMRKEREFLQIKERAPPAERNPRLVIACTCTTSFTTSRHTTKMVAQVQKPAPTFKAQAVVDGVFQDVSLSDFLGQW